MNCGALTAPVSDYNARPASTIKSILTPYTHPSLFATCLNNGLRTDYSRGMTVDRQTPQKKAPGNLSGSGRCNVCVSDQIPDPALLGFLFCSEVVSRSNPKRSPGYETRKEHPSAGRKRKVSEMLECRVALLIENIGAIRLNAPILR